jgi:hypothetical protein
LLGPVRAALGAVEHEVGAHLQEPAACRGKGFSKRSRSIGIHGLGQCWLTLGPIHGRVGTSIQHPIRAVRVHRGTAGLRGGEIQGQQPGTATAAGGDQLHPRGLRSNQRLAQLAGGAGEQHLHGWGRGRGNIAAIVGGTGKQQQGSS